MTVEQRYISKELTHFIGKALEDDNQRYELLINILKSCLLTYKPGVSASSRHLSITPSASFINGGMYNQSCVCFCDIPLEDIAIHIIKYGPFGISFLKSSRPMRAATPVFYVANESALTASKKRNRAEYFTRGIKAWHTFKAALREGHTNPKILELSNEFIVAESFIEGAILSFLKPFNNTLPENDTDNYYMEREWRVLGIVKFALNDVHRVILPSGYATRFRNDLPVYTGQLSFSD